MLNPDESSDNLVVTVQFALLLFTVDQSAIFSLAAGIFVLLSICKVTLDIIYHPRDGAKSKKASPAVDAPNGVAAGDPGVPKK